VNGHIASERFFVIYELLFFLLAEGIIQEFNYALCAKIARGLKEIHLMFESEEHYIFLFKLEFFE
jgi:hypothetical protein